MSKRSIMSNGPKVGRRTFTAGLAAGSLAALYPLRHGLAAGPLKVGVILPRSGHQAKLGESCQRGVEVALKMLSDMGFPQLEVIPGDTESDPKKAGVNAERLINNGAQLLVGAFDSGATIAIAAVAEQKQIPFVINIAAAPPITEQGYKFIFRNFPTARTLVGEAFKYQKALFEATGYAPKKGVMLAVNDTFGKAVSGAVEKLFPKMGMPYELTEVISYDPKARDLSVEIAKAKATGSDIVWPVSRLNDAIGLTREMIKQRWEPAAIITNGPGYYEDQYLKALGPRGDYVISIVPWYDPNKPLTETLRSEFRAMYPEIAVDTNVVYTFEGMLIAADAYKRAGSTDAAALQAALKATDISDNVSVGPGISFDEKGQNNGLGNAVTQNFNGEPLVVMPDAAKVADVVIPVPGWGERG